MSQNCTTLNKYELFPRGPKLCIIKIPGRKSAFHPFQMASSGLVPHDPMGTAPPISRLAPGCSPSGQDMLRMPALCLTGASAMALGSLFPLETILSVPLACSSSEVDHQGTAQALPHSWSRNVGQWGKICMFSLKASLWPSCPCVKVALAAAERVSNWSQSVILPLASSVPLH